MDFRIEKFFTRNVRFLRLPDNPLFSYMECFEVDFGNKAISIRWFHKKNFEINQCEPYAKLVNAYMNVNYRFVRPGSIVIDIGANNGDTTIPLAILACGGRVYAFEPGDAFLKYLTIQIGLNLGLNIEAYPYAIMEKEGIHKFMYAPNEDYNGGYGESNAWVGTYTIPRFVRAVNFKSFFESKIRFEDVSFIKIDTEGHDFHLLLDFKEIINDVRPVINAEWFPKTSHKIVELVEFISYEILCGFTLEKITTGSSWRQDIILVPKERIDSYNLP